MALLTRTIRPAFVCARAATLHLSARASIATASQTLEPANIPDPLLHSGQHTSHDLAKKLESTPSITPSKSPPAFPTAGIPNARHAEITPTITPSIRQLLPLMHSQPAHYITAHIHGRPYLLTAGDTLRLPFRMPLVRAGDVLRLTRATHIGSRDYTLKAAAATKGTADHGKIVRYLDDRLFECRATVVGLEREPVRVKEKTKRRQRHTRHVFSQHVYTVLRVAELRVKSLEEYEEELLSENIGREER